MKTPSSAPTATFGLEPAGYRRLLERFVHAPRILVYRGAGLSADAGLPTYRGAGEHLWSGDLLERVATLTGYARDLALHKLERDWTVTHVTQNVDALLERPGCATVLHLHGRLDELQCLRCRWTGAAVSPEALGRPCPHCSGQLRPAMNKPAPPARGWTIVQIMAALFVAGIVAAVVVDIVIDRRCQAEPALWICRDR